MYILFVLFCAGTVVAQTTLSPHPCSEYGTIFNETGLEISVLDSLRTSDDDDQTEISGVLSEACKEIVTEIIISVEGTLTTGYITNWFAANAHNLVSVRFNGIIRTVGNSAFYNCSSLQTVVFFDGLRSVFGTALLIVIYEQLFFLPV